MPNLIISCLCIGHGCLKFPCGVQAHVADGTEVPINGIKGHLGYVEVDEWGGPCHCGHSQLWYGSGQIQRQVTITVVHAWYWKFWGSCNDDCLI